MSALHQDCSKHSTQTDTCTHTDTRPRPRPRTHTHTHTHTNTRTRTHTHTHACTHKDMCCTTILSLSARCTCVCCKTSAAYGMCKTDSHAPTQACITFICAEMSISVLISTVGHLLELTNIYFLEATQHLLPQTHKHDACRYPGDEIPIIRGSALHALNGTEPAMGKEKVNIALLLWCGCYALLLDTSIHVTMYLCVCMYVCMGIYMCVCVLYGYIYIYIYIYINIYIYIYI